MEGDKQVKPRLQKAASSPLPSTPSQAGETRIVIGDSPQALEDGTEATSPDGRYSARLSPAFPDPTITITDKTTGKTTEAGFIPAVYAMAWTPKSDALVVVDHIAHGRVLHVITRSKDEWKIPKEDLAVIWGANIAPLEITLGEKVIHFRSGTSSDPYDREKQEYYITSFDYDLASGRKLHETNRRLSAAEAESKGMRASLNYVPPAIERLQKERAEQQ